MAQHTFTVGEIHCGACETAIRKSLSRVDGVRHVEPDAATNKVTVVFDEQLLDLGQLAGRLDAAGYPVLA
ncbi:MAG: heavy-metal-associated domain-containing protein [Actinobacteria bacterium]|nr:heavy-metal-associated domain-containing protein [Actinomycetota bacterium]MBW3646164.1 heavy-metal-associated domain-containing protein [Actinomycetota bacterium]